MKSCIRSQKDIVVGQFYQAMCATDYYYVGIKYGNQKRLIVLNLSQAEADDNDPLFPDSRSMYRDWEFAPVSQKEAMTHY